MSETLIQSYVWHKSNCFFVSTIDRDSSALAGPGRYAETLVWEYDYEEHERGQIVGQDEGVEGSIRTHLVIVQRLYETGQVEAVESD